MEEQIKMKLTSARDSLDDLANLLESKVIELDRREKSVRDLESTKGAAAAPVEISPSKREGAGTTREKVDLKRDSSLGDQHWSDLYHQVWNDVPVGIITIQHDGADTKSWFFAKLIHANPYAFEMSQAEVLVGKLFMDVVSPADCEELSLVAAEVSKSGSYKEISSLKIVFINPKKNAPNDSGALFRVRIFSPKVSTVTLLFEQINYESSIMKNHILVELEPLLTKALRSILSAESDKEDSEKNGVPSFRAATRIFTEYWLWMADSENGSNEVTSPSANAKKNRKSINLRTFTLGRSSSELKDVKKSLNLDNKLKLDNIDNVIQIWAEDPTFRTNFIITYRYWTDPTKLFMKLCLRFITQQDASQQKIILDIIELWVEKFFSDFMNDPGLFKMLHQFLKNVLTTSFVGSKRVAQLIMLIETQNSIAIVEVDETKHKSWDIDFRITNYQPLEVAQHLTMIAWRLYQKIRPSELTGQIWTKKDGIYKAPNILSLISITNRIARWVVSTIVATPSLNERVEIVKFFIQVAAATKKHHDYSTMYAICMGLENSAVARLKNTWNSISDAYILRKFKDISNACLLESNSKNYRNMLKKYTSPSTSVIPYLGVILKDLTFIEDGNDSKEGDGQVNMSKMKMISDVIISTMGYQEVLVKYDYPEQRHLKAYLLYDMFLLTEDEYHAASKQREPKSVSLRIIVADASKLNHKIIMKHFERLGDTNQTVIYTSSGKETLKVLESSHYDLVIIDSMMPDLSGIECSEYIRKIPSPFKQPMIVGVSGKADEIRQRCISSGMDEVIRKPVNIGSLETILGQAKRYVFLDSIYKIIST